MPRFRSKPVEIEATQWWHATDPGHPGVEIDSDGPFVTTVHGERAHLTDGDWIIPEPTPGRYYPCKPDIFDKRYEPI